MGRELSLFLSLDATAVPARQRAGYVALEVRRAAPFADPEHDLVWFGDRAAVWYWSRERVRTLAGTVAPRTRFRSEACYRGQLPEGDGVQLLALPVAIGNGSTIDAGVEARQWKQGQLVSSRWWPALPATADWQAFLRGCGLSPATARPEPVAAGLRASPLSGGAQPRNVLGHFQAQSALLATAAAAIVVALFAWQAAGLIRVAQETRYYEERIAALEKRLDAVITARGSADESLARIEALLALRPPASQTRLMGEIHRITPGSDWRIMLWQMPGPETVEITLKGANLDAAAIVQAWEQSPLLQDVTPASGSRTDEVTLQARLTPLTEQRS